MREPGFSEAAAALAQILGRGDRLYWNPQVARAFYRAAVGAAGENGLGLSPAQARVEREEAILGFEPLDDEPGIFGRWRGIVARYGSRGARIFGANLVAAALHHGLSGVVTLDAKDLRRYEGEGLEIAAPATLAGRG